MRFSSDFEPNSDSCDSLGLFFLSWAEFQLCHASFVVQCTGENEKRLASPDRQSDGRMNFWHVWNVGCSSWRYRTFEAELRTDCHKLSAFPLTAPAQKQYFNYLNYIAARKKTKRGRSLDFAISYKKNNNNISGLNHEGEPVHTTQTNWKLHEHNAREEVFKSSQFIKLQKVKTDQAFGICRCITAHIRSETKDMGIVLIYFLKKKNILWLIYVDIYYQQNWSI